MTILLCHKFLRQTNLHLRVLPSQSGKPSSKHDEPVTHAMGLERPSSRKGGGQAVRVLIYGPIIKILDNSLDQK
jgi:hypothetical protein